MYVFPIVTIYSLGKRFYFMGRFYMTWRNCMLMYDTLYETLKPLCLIGVLLYRNNLWKSCFYLLFSHKTCCFGKFSGWYFSFYHFSVPEGPNYSSVVSSSDIFLSASRVSIVSFWLFSWDSHVTPFSMANGQYISFFCCRRAPIFLRMSPECTSINVVF